MASIRFCPECNYIMYPEENLTEKQLSLKCRVCSYSCAADSPVVYVNKMKKDAENKLDLVDTDMARDPTLPRTFDSCCPQCKGEEAVFFMSRTAGKDSDMGLVFLCANEACLHKWLN